MDGKTDHITSKSFHSYDESYDLLASIYEEIWCSYADYDNRPFYEINKITKVSH